jgi:hypothetical protein
MRTPEITEHSRQKRTTITRQMVLAGSRAVLDRLGDYEAMCPSLSERVAEEVLRAALQGANKGLKSR